MTKRQFWLKLFSENDTSLATAIHLCSRFVSDGGLQANKAQVAKTKDELDDEMDPGMVAMVFPECAKSDEN